MSLAELPRGVTTISFPMKKIPRTAGCAILKIRPSVGLVPVGISTGAGLRRHPRG